MLNHLSRYHLGDFVVEQLHELFALLQPQHDGSTYQSPKEWGESSAEANSTEKCYIGSFSKFSSGVSLNEVEIQTLLSCVLAAVWFCCCVWVRDYAQGVPCLYGCHFDHHYCWNHQHHHRFGQRSQNQRNVTKR